MNKNERAEFIKKEAEAQTLETLQASGSRLAMGCLVGLKLKADGKFNDADNAKLLAMTDMLAVISEVIFDKQHAEGLITDSEFASLKAKLDEANAQRPSDEGEVA